MHLSESILTRKVIRWIRNHYPQAWVYKAADRWTSGIPDLLICKEGRFYAIELKVGTTKVTRLQAYVIKRIQDAGGRASVCRSLDEVQQFFERR